MEEDRRTEEFECIAAIFPEIEFDTTDQFRASIELPVNPRNPVTVAFPAASDGVLNLPTPPLSTGSGEGGATDNLPGNNTESHELTYLPSLQLHVALPEGYPETEPPKFELSTTPAWLPRAHLDELEVEGLRMWEEMGHDSVIFAYIDSLQQGAENAFGYGEKGKILEISQEDKISLLDFDINAIQAAFNKGTYDCGVCLDPKRGSACHKMIDCGHVFCIECLQNFYNNAIKEGDLISVRCLAPNCAKERAERRAKKNRKSKTQLSPSELLQIPLEHDVVARFVKLKHKAQLESDKNTVYCPRSWCNGAAKSKKYRKPKGLEDDDNSDDESGTETKGKGKEIAAGADRLAICEDSWLEPANPYRHFNEETTGCFQRLWELEAGDGDDVGRGYDGGVQPVPAIEIIEEEIAVPEVEEPQPGIPDPEEEIEQGERQEVERQAPLVLRLNQPLPAAPAVPDAPQPPLGPANRQHRPNQGRGHGAHRGRVGGLNRQEFPRLELPRLAAGRGQGRVDMNHDPDEQHAANQAWVQRFVQMALNDEEDQLEWDDEAENHAVWEIPVR
ncbi:hypothetical protein DSL72_008887 [Monilinia vaccinii-corymbosi]|uniref:RWD domain-containing protein n=1 Tax=Monilinia vaccinii-corymbosi TaxID=61207 RepID=A0A8A3PQM1_9HELO|nr:hypothetical protein DSL72_008887 [Monilinia vaccinii-corymbosi]